MSKAAPFFSVIDYTVDGPSTQAELAESFAAIQRDFVSSHPGYVSSRIIASTDGGRLLNVIEWESEEHFAAFEANSDTSQRMEAIRRAVEGVSGTAELRMTESPRYRLLAEVRPQGHP